MVTTNYKYSVSEVLDILKHMNEEDIEKIPLDIIKDLNDNQDSSYTSTIDFTKPLEESDISPKALAIIAYIYKEYLCNEDEKKEYMEIIKNNDAILENKYTTAELFKNTPKIKEPNLTVIPIEQTTIERIINKFKNIFK